MLWVKSKRCVSVEAVFPVSLPLASSSPWVCLSYGWRVGLLSAGLLGKVVNFFSTLLLVKTIFPLTPSTVAEMLTVPRQNPA